ncbi:major facilitator superfamily transporter [Biscogniauxia marginata]|nr:major facilitator superfamily transporter [Biscogniauxia marginata]
MTSWLAPASPASPNHFGIPEFGPPSGGSQRELVGNAAPFDWGQGAAAAEYVVDGGAETTATAGAGEDWKPTRSFYLAFMPLCILVLAMSMDGTSISVALPTISTSLGGTALEAFWSGTSYLLASAVLQPSVASMSSILGRKYMIYFSSALFAGGSLIGALARNFSILLVGRTLQGIGGGNIMALTEIVITDLVPLAHRGTWFSVLSMMTSIGTVTGPLIGAGFAQNVDWRWIFWINLPIIGLALVFVVLFLHQMRIPGNTVSKLMQFDWTGSLIFTVGSTTFLFGLTTGGIMYEWSSWRILLPLIIGPLVIVGFVFWELKFANEPIIDRGIFNNWTLISTYIQTAFHGVIVWALLYFIVLYFQAVKMYSIVISALGAMTGTLTVAPSAVVVGMVAGRIQRYRWAVWGGWALATLGGVLLYFLNPDTSIPGWIFLNIPIGIGTGMLFPAISLATQAASEPALNGQAAAFLSFVRTFGQAAGVAISGVIFQNAFKARLLALPALAGRADAYSRDATIVVGIIAAMPDGAERAQLVRAFADGLRAVWLSLVGFAAASLLLSASVRGYSLQQEHVTKQGLRPDMRQRRSVSAGEELACVPPAVLRPPASSRSDVDVEFTPMGRY